jgi:hypothetical protein
MASHRLTSPITLHPLTLRDHPVPAGYSQSPFPTLHSVWQLSITAKLRPAVDWHRRPFSVQVCFDNNFLGFLLAGKPSTYPAVGRESHRLTVQKLLVLYHIHQVDHGIFWNMGLHRTLHLGKMQSQNTLQDGIPAHPLPSCNYM